jgi:nicotinamide-nucleotide amidase
VGLVNADIPALSARLLTKEWKLTTAESCTGGLIAAHCTDLIGSSAWFDRGFVTYSNEAKTELLGVPLELIASDGAVSESVALAMALGAFFRSKATVSVAVTGIAGPAGGSPAKPVGTVWLSWCIQGVADAEKRLFSGDRASIRQSTVDAAIAGLLLRIC